MDDVQRRQIVSAARDFWDRDHPLKAGMLIFERIPLASRADWAADILEFAYQHIDPISEIDAVVHFARHPELWSREQRREAHGIIEAVQARSRKSLVDGLVLQLAEHTGAIAYTSTQLWDLFDHNRGWYIADVLNKTVKALQLDEAVAWQIIANELYILLDEPVMCHWGCPICCYPPKWDYLPEIK
jgi:hypothetical protein